MNETDKASSLDRRAGSKSGWNPFLHVSSSSLPALTISRPPGGYRNLARRHVRSCVFLGGPGGI